MSAELGKVQRQLRSVQAELRLELVKGRLLGGLTDSQKQLEKELVSFIEKDI